MITKDRALRVTLSKVKHYDGRQWCGYLTPMEIESLCYIGIKADARDLDRADQKRDNGEGGGEWFYFYPGPALLELLSKTT